jgi:aspartyl/asparaginyl-tRNA synthetase
MDLAEGLISFLVQRCLEKRRIDLQTINRDITKLEKITAPFPRITYDEAVRMLQEGHAKGALESKFEWGGDLGSPDETYLSGQFDKPVMVHRYPAQVKAFYMEPDPQRPDLALCVDVLAPEGYGEIIGGSQRLASYDLLLQRIREHGLPEEAFKWYLELNGRLRGFADWSMCARQFRLPGRCTGCTHKYVPCEHSRFQHYSQEDSRHRCSPRPWPIPSRCGHGALGG